MTIPSSASAPASSLTLALPTHAGTITHLAWATDSTQLAAVTSAGFVAVWETRQGTRLLCQRITSAALSAVAWSGQERCLLVGSVHGTLSVLHLSTRALALAYTFPERISRIAWCPHMAENRFFVVTGHTLRIFLQWKSDPLVLQYATPILDACWKPDGQQIALVCQNGLIEVWDAPRRRIIWQQTQPLLAPSGLTWDATGQRLAIGTRAGTIQVHQWQRDQPKEEVSLSRFPLQTLRWGEHVLVARSEEGMVRWNMREQTTSCQPTLVPTTLTLDSQGTLLATALQGTIAITAF